MNGNGFDSIVVGAGAGGCVAARRLAEAGRRVALVEPGPWVPSAAIRSVDALGALGEPDWVWPDVVTAGPSGVVRRYFRGRGAGGSSAINTLVVAPGDPTDYDRWEGELGCAGWNWAAVGPAIDRVMARLDPIEAEPGPTGRAVIAAASNAGHEPGGLSGEPGWRGVGPATLTVRRGSRWSAADAYLGDDGHRPHLVVVGADDVVSRVAVAAPSVTVVTGAADRLLHPAGAGIGVAVVGREPLWAPHVVVSAGAVHTPVLLDRSGVGAGRLGRRAHDHPSFVFTVALTPGAQLPEAPTAPVSAVLRWASEAPPRPRPGGVAHGTTGARGTPPADLMGLVLDHVGSGPGRRYGAVVVALTGADSRGGMPGEEGGTTNVRPGWLEGVDDRRRLRAGVRHMAELLTGPELASVAEGVYLDDSGTPLAEMEAMDDDRLDRWLLEHPGPVSHLASTAPLSPDPGDVLDLDCFVRGWPGLQVADASVLPCLPNGNPQVPVMAVVDHLMARVIGHGQLG